MKALYLIPLLAVIFFSVRNRDLPLPTRGAEIQDQVNRVVSLSEDLDFSCTSDGYSTLTDRLNINLVWGKEKARCPDKWGCALDSHIWMVLDTCHTYADEVFFHEIGHVVLGHSYCYHDSKDITEVEADHFAIYVMQDLGMRFEKHFAK